MQNLLIKKGVSFFHSVPNRSSVSLSLPPQTVDPLNQHRTACCAFIALASQHVQLLKTVHNNIIKERKDWMEEGRAKKKRKGEIKAVHKIITLFSLCRRLGVDEPQKDFGWPEDEGKIANSPVGCTARTY